MNAFWYLITGTTIVALIPELTPDTDYYFKVQATTLVGAGPSSHPPVKVHSHGSSSQHGWLVVKSERDMGIIAGVCIGGGCIIICAIIILMRNRYVEE